jgi:hypothetical protein
MGWPSKSFDERGNVMVAFGLFLDYFELGDERVRRQTVVRRRKTLNNLEIMFCLSVPCDMARPSTVARFVFFLFLPIRRPSLVHFCGKKKQGSLQFAGSSSSSASPSTINGGPTIIDD